MTTTLTARGPEDLLAAVPVLLGFQPEDSLVMLTFGAERTFHARLDLPEAIDDASLEEVVETLLAPCRTHGVDHVAFVVYSADRGMAAALAAALVPAFVTDGVGVVDVLRADRGCWCSVPVRAPNQPATTPCAISCSMIASMIGGACKRIWTSVSTALPDQNEPSSAKTGG